MNRSTFFWPSICSRSVPVLALVAGMLPLGAAEVKAVELDPVWSKYSAELQTELLKRVVATVGWKTRPTRSAALFAQS